MILYFTTGSIQFKNVDARRYGSNVAAFSAAIGEQIGIGFINFMLNNTIAAGVGAIQATPALVQGNGTAAISFTELNNGLSLLGDASNSIVAWVMNGVAFHELVEDGISNYKIDTVAGGSIASGGTQSLGRPIYTTDSPALLQVPAGKAVMGLTRGALKMAETATREVVAEVLSGQENLVSAVQAESDVLLSVKGYTWVGGAQPLEADLYDPTNWALAATDVKAGPGVIVNVL